MIRLQAYKFQIEPNGEQILAMRQFAGNARKVWNLALDRQQTNHAAGEKFTTAFGMNYWLPTWKKEYPFLLDSPAQTLQQVMTNLERGYTNFFEKRADFPRFKKKGRHDSFRFPQGFKLDQGNSRLFLPKLGWLRYRNSRKILGTAKNITVSASSGKWFVSIQTQREVEQPVHPATSIVGIDVGITRFATLSTGSHVEPLNTFRRHQQRLARSQQALSRKQKFSRNWKKAKTKVQKIHTQIANARRDFLHKTTTTISNNHAIVCLEELQIRNMSKSAAGSTDLPGRNVKVKSGLNKSILDQGWSEFRRQLEYKQAWRGGEVLAVPPRNTSRRCPACGHVAKENRQTQARFACVACGYENHADLVGALNIVAAGHAVLACGGMAQSGHPMKQEPAEATQVAHAA